MTGRALRLRVRGRAAVATAAGTALALSSGLAPAATDTAGARLFDGRTPMVGTIVGHSRPLPPSAVRCRNCHADTVPPADPAGIGARAASDAPGASEPPRAAAPAVRPPVGIAGANRYAETAGTPFGPVLDRARLTGTVARRGGPPSTYDRELFCRTLHSGWDPADVLLPRTMPRYTLTDRQCDALWRYLTQR